MNQHHAALISEILEPCGIFQQYLVCLATWWLDHHHIQQHLAAQNNMSWLIGDFTLFWHIWPNLTPITNFLGQNDYSILLNYFWLTFSAIWENVLESFFRKVPKTVILAIFCHVWPKSAKMRIFIKNRAVLFFYPYCPPTSCQVWEKSVERFPRSIRYIHPSIHPSIHTKVKP